MADVSDVESALATIIAAALYPGGVPSVAAGAPPPPSSACAAPVRVYRGWPVKENLDLDLAAGILNVSIFPQPKMTRLTTRYPRRWQRQGPTAQPTLIWAINGTTATLSGTVTVPQNLALIINGVMAFYQVQAADTIASILASFAGTLNATLATESGLGFSLDGSGGSLTIDTGMVSGSTITSPGAYQLIGRAGVFQPMIKEIRRQQQGFQVSCWSPNPAARDALAIAVDGALSPLTFITLADGTAARLQYENTMSTDRAENDTLFRRDLNYKVEYASTIVESAPQVIVVRSSITGYPPLPIVPSAGTSLNISADI